VALTDAQARTLGAILAGAYFKPAVVEEIEAVIGDLLIDWVTLDDSSPGAGKTIAELEVRRATRMTIAAILRGHVPLVAPEPTEQLLPGDRLVVVGRQEDLPAFYRHIVQG
jgi:TrkA domain protein